jgi:endonuclease-3
MTCDELGWDEILDTMVEEAKKRKAPVFNLNFKNPFQHLIFAVLSSRTRDEKTAEVAQKLYERVKHPEDLKKMSLEEIEEIIKGAGFYKVKAKRLKSIAEMIVRDYNSKIPSKFEDLVKLPGIGRKTANVILAHAFGEPAIGVDTHVHRISNRMGFVRTEKVKETEMELKKLVPKNLWVNLNKAFVGFGQTLCKPLKPLCDECPFNECCPKIF